MHIHTHQNIGTRMFISAVFIIAPKLEIIQMHIERRMDKYMVVYSLNEVGYSNESKCLMVTCNDIWTNLTKFSERNQGAKEKVLKDSI